jgi:hypothetical protein
LSIPASVSDGGAGGFLDNPPANQLPFAFADRPHLLLHYLGQATLACSPARPGAMLEEVFHYFLASGPM